MYDIIFDERALDILETLQKKDRKRIYEKIISTKEQPFHYFERLTGREEYKLRIGVYRIIAEIDEHSKKISILMIGHRKHIYQKL